MLLLGVATAAAETEPQIYSYDFDLEFRLEAREYPYRIRSRMKGYEELLESLALKGTLAWNTANGCMDLNGRVIPKSNPGASIEARIYGKHGMLCVDTPLLGPKTYGFGNSFGLMSFANQFWLTTGLDLPTLLLLDPRTTTDALKKEAAAWTEVVPELKNGTVITPNQLSKIRDSWKTLLAEDEDLLMWLDAIFALTTNKAPADEAIRKLPDLLPAIAGGKNLTVKKDGDSLVCVNAKQEKVFTLTDNDSEYTFEFDPQTEALEQRLYLRLHRGTDGIALAFSIGGESETLISLSLTIRGIPETFPTDATIVMDATAGGSAFPQITLRTELTATAAGDVKALLSEVKEGGATEPLLSCFGTVTATAYEGTLEFEERALKKPSDILIPSYQLINEKLEETVPYLARGLISFVYELPIKSCQSVLDTLESYGLLRQILSGL